MTENPVLKTVDIGAEQDTYVDEANGSTNYGDHAEMWVGLDGSGNAQRIYLRFTLPDRPDDCHEDSSDSPYNYKLRVYRQQIVGSGNRTKRTSYLTAVRAIDEMAMTWNNRPVNLSNLADTVMDDSTTGYIETDINSALLRGELRWGEVLMLAITELASYSNGQQDRFESKESTFGKKPLLRLQYYETVPENVAQLTIAPDPDDASRPKLSWEASDDPDFSHYEIWRKVGGGAYAQIGSDISEIGTNEYVDSTSITENVVVYYYVRVERSDGAYNESGEVWFIRPDVSTFEVDDTSPDVLQELLFTVDDADVAATPTPVVNVSNEFVFGTPAQSDGSSATVPDLTRTHRYGYFGSQTPSVQITNSLGFKSNSTQLTTGGPTLTISDIVPVAVVKASPVVVAVNVVVRFFGDESYAPAGNRELASTNAYEWDKDYSVSFSLDDATTLPYKDYSWSGAGTKTVALRVKDAASAYSTHVIIQVEVVAVSTVNLDALADGYEVIDVDRSRTVIVQEGIEAKKIVRGSEKIVGVSIGGFAFTDIGANGIPDDIETLEDIVANNKRIQISVHGTVRYGALSFRTHTEGGWDDKFNWTATLVLE